MTLDPTEGGRNTVVQLAREIGSGERSALEVTRHYLARCKASSLNALTFVAEEAAERRAAELDSVDESARGKPLFGVPIVVKDAICTRGLPTTAGSNILRRRTSSGLEGYRPPYDATVVERLLEAGAVVLAKANMDEFAMGSSNENSAYGPVRNPWDETRIPGGSSGGSAAAVAAGLAPASLGSDTGGSIRQPASLTGLVGVKPTFGRVSRYGLIAYASSLDQVGPLTPDVRSSARILEVLAGFDPRDSTSAAAPVGRYEAATERRPEKLRVGLPEEYFGDGLEPAVRARIDEVRERLAGAGAELVPVNLPHTDYGIAAYYLIATAEASSNLSRFDGVRFGLREEPAGGGLGGLYEASRGAGFGAEVQRRIILGTYALSAGYYDAYYGKAQRVRTLIRRDFEAAFRSVDVLLTPVSPTPAFRLGEKTENPLSMYLADVYTLPASLAGIPGISVPVGTVSYEGATLPVGVQLLAPHFEEERLFSVAALVERLVSEG